MWKVTLPIILALTGLLAFTQIIRAQGPSQPPDLNLSKSVTPASANPSQIVTHTLTFANATGGGIGPAPSAVITGLYAVF